MPWSSKENNNNENKDDVWGSESSNSTRKTVSNKAGSSGGSGSGSGSGSPSSSTKSSGLGGVAGIMDSMENFKTAQQVGKMTNSLVQELASTTVEGIAVEGKVSVLFDGQQQPVSVNIDSTYLKTVDASDLNLALTTAMKDAYKKSAERMDEKMKSFYVDLGLK